MVRITKKYTRNVKFKDGDSGTFSDGTGFRLSNVRAPEKKQVGGQKAKKVASGMVGRSKGRVNIEEVGRDKYGRLLVKMSNKDGSVNERMRKKGYTNKGR
ncbi:nuclease [Methanolobus psychrophilus R15]|nr:nuclease [Methanolobus psychrophilus R15]